MHLWQKKKYILLGHFNGNLSYRLRFCSTNRGTSKGSPIPPVFRPQPTGTLFCSPTGPGPAAGSSSQELFPDRASRCSFLSGLPFIWLWKNSRLISEIWSSQLLAQAPGTKKCQNCAAVSCVQRQNFLSWSSGTTQTLCLFSCWTQAEGRITAMESFITGKCSCFFFFFF